MFHEAEFDAILRAARAGADWAWRALYDDLAPRLAGYARACRVADAEDLVGEVFVRAVRALERFEGGERDFRAWMFALARNGIIDERRKVVRRRTEPLPPEVLAELGPTGDVEQEAMRALAEDRVRAALAPLTPDQRDVILLRVLAGLTIDEVAVVVGKRPGAVKALQARALATIRRNIFSGAVTL
jgi:RNA polymerase sigma factor (sigma-70 family)